MLYDRYREKMKKVAAFLGRLYAHKVLVTVGLVVLLAIMAGLFAVKGTILFESDCPTEVEYGDKLGYRVYPVLSFATYEYTPAGTGDWSREAPVYPGNYEVRAMVRTALGQKVYTEAHAFAIVPRSIVVRVAESSIDYGEEPSAKADLARGDKLDCTIRFGNRNSRNPDVWVERGSIRITAKDGEDRTRCYRIEDTPTATLRIKPRKLKITVSDASKVFDDIRLSYDAYEVSGGKLLKGDSLVAVFYASITEAGSIENTPTLQIYNADGRDVTVFYELDIRAGKLTVEKRSLILHTGSKSFVYNGMPQTYDSYYIDGSTPLVSGHTLRVAQAASITDVGKVKNALTVTVSNAQGKDRTGSYSVFVEAGTLEVTPRSVTVETPTGSVVYNGEAQSVTQGIRVDNGVGDDVRAVSPATLTGVGSTENRMSVTFHRDGQDVTKNYVIQYRYGTLTVTRRPIHVKIKDVSREYNKQPLTSTAFICDTSLGYSLPSADTLTLQTVGEITRVGTVQNRYVDGSVEIRNKRGESVLSNYEITVEDGTLTVIPRAITVASASDSWAYDGTVKRNHTFEVTRGSLVDGQSLEVEVVTECLNVGIYQNLMETTETRVWDGKEDVTDQYNITHTYGRLRITGHPITVHTESGEWMYDGEEHSIPYSEAVRLDPATPLLDGHSIEFSGGRGITAAGTLSNTYTALIYDESGRDMSKNYEITYKTGTLTVHKRPITVYTGDGTRVYNGRSEVIGEAVLTEDSPYPLVKGQNLRVGTWDKTDFIDAGEYQNEYKVAIMDRNYLDVTANYEISYLYGSMRVVKRAVELQVDVVKVYSGLRFDSVEAKAINNTSLAAGHKAEALFGTVGVDVGTYTADVNIIIRDERGRNVTDNYIHSCETGTVTITPRHISVITADASKVYDGRPLEAHEAGTTKNSLPLGHQHQLELTVTGTGTEIGIYPNTAEFDTLRILDSKGTDVTANYVIDHTLEGVLTVRHNVMVVVTTGSASKTYDGLPLRESGYTVDVTEGQLPAGYVVDVRTTGVITMPGSTDNTAVVTVRNAHGEDVTALVGLATRLGTLTVIRDTDPGKDSIGSFDPGAVGTYDLRMASYGMFNGRDWLDAVPYPYADRVVTLPGLVLKNLGMTTRTMRFMDMKQLLMPYYVTPDSSTVPPTDTVYGAPPSEQYEVEVAFYDRDLAWLSLYMELPEIARAALLGSHYADELAYRTFVHEQYLAVDDETLAYMQTFAENAELNAADPDIVSKVAAAIRRAAVYTAAYDPLLDREENIAIAFLDEYAEGSERHFATAATLLYRTLGLPARYVTGYRVTMDSTWVTPTIKDPGYAWVEVYIDGFGWLQIDPTGEEKKPTDDKRPVLELEPAFACKVYDGETLSAPHRLTATASLAALLNQGYTYTANVLGNQTEIGVSESVVMDFTLYDAKGRDVTAEYRLVKNTGLVRVVGESVTVMLSQISKTYDGRPLTYQANDYRILSMPEGADVELTLALSMTDVGVMTLNDVNRHGDRFVTEYRVTMDGEDVTELYPLLFVLSGDDLTGNTADQPPKKQSSAAEPVLIIQPRAIELTAASEIRVYDGTPLVDPDVTLTGGQLVAGHSVIAEAIGRCTEPGTVENAVGDVRILDADGNDVTAFYIITRVSGTLTLVGDEDY